MFLDSFVPLCNFSCFNFRSFVQILEHILKIRREKAKQEFWQSVGNHLALRNFLFALRNWQCGFSHCEIRCGFSHCEIRNVVFRIAKFAVVFRIAKFRIAKFAVVFRIAKFATHCEQFAN